MGTDSAGREGTEAALFVRLQHGDDGAFRELFCIYADQLLGTARAVLGDSDGASDVVQDVFVALWTNRGRYDVPDDVGRYLRRAVRNRALKLLARDATASRLKHNIAVDVAGTSAAFNDAPATLDTADREAALTVALATLQPRTREIFLLARAGLNSGAIAELLGIGLGTVYNQLSRAIKLLARQLARWDE